MIRQVFVLLFAGLLAIEVNSVEIKSLRTKLSNVNPRALIDEVTQQLDVLRESVKGASSTATSNIETYGSNLQIYGGNLVQTGQLAIQQEHETITGQVQVIRDLGYSAGVDVSSCIDIREQIINLLPEEYTNQMRTCVFSTNGQSDIILQNARYYVDVYINQVNALEFQLGLCAADSIVCISAIASQIELATVQLPQNIILEARKAHDLLEVVKVPMDECYNTKVAQYSGDANALLNDISECANELLS